MQGAQRSMTLWVKRGQLKELKLLCTHETDPEHTGYLVDASLSIAFEYPYVNIDILHNSDCLFIPDITSNV